MGVKYKTAKQLGITEAERTVLLKARAWLARASAVHYTPIEGNGGFKFDMGRTLMDPYVPNDPNCRSVGCIWGLCYVIAKAQKIKSAFKTSPYGRNHSTPSENGVSILLDKMFFPHNFVPGRLDFYDNITPAMAADWIAHWLKTGEYDLTKLGHDPA